MLKNRGFTLIELTITVAIIGILAAIAYPSFMDQIRKSRRADAQAELMNIAARQQQTLLDTRSYAASVSALNITLPASVRTYYTMSLVVGTATVPSFTANAVPISSQAVDKCATLSVDHNGTRSPSNCW